MLLYLFILSYVIQASPLDIISIKRGVRIEIEGNNTRWLITETYDLKFNKDGKAVESIADLFGLVDGKFFSIDQFNVYKNDELDEEILNKVYLKTSTDYETIVYQLDQTKIKKNDRIRIELIKTIDFNFYNIQQFNVQYLKYKIQQAELSIDVPRQLEDRFFIENQSHSNQAHITILASTDKRYTWSFTQIDPYEVESYSRGYNLTRQAVIYGLNVESWEHAYRLNNYANKYKECFADTAGLGHFLSAVNIKNKAAKEIVSIIYRYLQEKVRYAYVDLHKDGYVPHRMKSILDRGKGDCKDYSTILIATLRSLGFEAYMVDVLTNNRTHKFRHDVKYLIQFNHALVQVSVDNQLFYLDATGSIFDINDIRSDVQGQEAILFNDLNGKVTKINLPLSKAKNNQMRFDVEAKITNKVDLQGTIKLTVLGYLTHDLRDVINKARGNDLDNFFQRFFSQKNNEIEISKIEALQSDTYSDSIAFRFEFQLNGFVSDLGGVNGFLMNFLNNSYHKKLFKTERKQDYYFTTPSYRMLFSYSIGLENQNIDYVADNQSIENPSFYYNLSVNKSNKTLNYSLEFERRRMEIDAEKSKEMRQFFIAYNNLFSEYVIFK